MTVADFSARRGGVSAPGALFGFCVLALTVPGALGQSSPDYESYYTDLDLETCRFVGGDEYSAEWACPGYGGVPVRVVEGDLRFYVSYGHAAEKEVAAFQTPVRFNTLGPRIEWLVSAQEGIEGSILRFYLDPIEPGDPTGQVLVVTAIHPGNTCQIAYIDASANANANQMARDAAQSLIRGFDCDRDEPVFYGTFFAW